MKKITVFGIRILVFFLLMTQLNACKILKLGQIKPSNPPDIIVEEDTNTSNKKPQISIHIPINSKIVFVSGQEITLESPPAYVDSNSTTMVPLRFISDIIGAKVEWIPETKEIVITQESKEIKLQINSYVALVNLMEETLTSPPQIKEERAFVPLKFIAQTLGFNSDWIATTKTVVLTK